MASPIEALVSQQPITAVDIVRHNWYECILGNATSSALGSLFYLSVAAGHDTNAGIFPHIKKSGACWVTTPNMAARSSATFLVPFGNEVTAWHRKCHGYLMISNCIHSMFFSSFWDPEKSEMIWASSIGNAFPHLPPISSFSGKIGWNLASFLREGSPRRWSRI